MKVEFEGRTWEFDPDDLDVRQATVLHLTHGMTIKAWSDGFADLDYRSYHFAYWLMLQQAGIVRPIADCNPKVIDFIVAYQEGRTAEAAAQAAEEVPEPDPTNEPPSGPQGEPTASKAHVSQKATTRPHRARQQEEESTGS